LGKRLQASATRHHAKKRPLRKGGRNPVKGRREAYRQYGSVRELR
jgi:hypothetical protein